MITQQYSAGIMSQSFWFTELKQLLKLKKENKTEAYIKNLVIDGNLFGAPNEYRSKRIYGYLLNRVNSIEDDLLDIFFNCDLSTQKIINLVAILRQDKLFFEFLYEVYRNKLIVGDLSIDKTDAKVFLNKKEMQDNKIAQWTDSTKIRIQGAYFTFMAEAGLLKKDGKKWIINSPILDISLENYLKANGESFIVKALTGES